MSEETAIVAQGPRIPRRELWLDVPEYPGFRAKMWANHPQRLARDLQSKDVERIASALSAIVLEHNGWCDEEGDPYPPAGELREIAESVTEDGPDGAPITRTVNRIEYPFYEAIPTELAVLLIVLINEAATTLPNSLLRTRRR